MYLGYQNGKIKFYTEQQLNTVLYQIDKSEFTNDEYVLDGEEYVLKDKAWEEKQEAKEAERVAKLNMTRGDFFEGLILAQGKDEDDVLALIDILDLTDIEKKVFKSRVKNALDFYRGYPLIDKMCEYLGLSTEQMTQFFETKDYKYLLPDKPVEEETE